MPRRARCSPTVASVRDAPPAFSPRPSVHRTRRPGPPRYDDDGIGTPAAGPPLPCLPRTCSSAATASPSCSSTLVPRCSVLSLTGLPAWPWLCVGCSAGLAGPPAGPLPVHSGGLVEVCCWLRCGIESGLVGGGG